MSRLPELNPSTLTPEQTRAYEAVKQVRGSVRGPYAIWVRAGELAEKAVAMQNMFTTRGSLDKRLFELAVIILARRSSSQFAWFIHAPQALKHGVSKDVVETIKSGGIPHYSRDDEKLVHDVVVELDETRTLSDATYDRAVRLLGVETLVELVAAIGFYTMVAISLNVFDAPVPGGERPLI